jgi:2-hydroxy-3-oxopropionate reductase
MNIGFIGLGIMGKPMAKNLLKAGHKLVVYDILDAPVRELVQAGATAGSSPKDVASRSELIITMLPNSPHVKEAVLGKNGVIEGAKPGSVLLKMATSAVLCGDIGAGNVTKLANQIIVALNIAAMSEAFVLAAKAGVDPERVFDAVKGGLAGSTVLNAKAPMVLQGNYKPGFRIELHIKDLQNALDTAHEIGVPIPLTSQVMEMMQALKVDGKQTEDHGGLIQFYEKLAGVKVRKGGTK